mgnify:CR=1 FL=1
MKYYKICFPGEYEQHVEEIWSEEQIIKSYYPYWSGMMIQNVASPDLNPDTCISDWCVTHWAVEVPKPEWITEYSEEYDAYYDPNTNEWFESVCDDENCEFCNGRPERPL